MSINIIHESNPRARRNYSCDACNFLFNLNFPSEIGLTFSECRAVIKARKSGYRILKGERYIRQFNGDNSRNVWTFRAIPEIHNICAKYDLYEE